MDKYSKINDNQLTN